MKAKWHYLKILISLLRLSYGDTTIHLSQVLVFTIPPCSPLDMVSLDPRVHSKHQQSHCIAYYEYINEHVKPIIEYTHTYTHTNLYIYIWFSHAFGKTPCPNKVLIESSQLISIKGLYIIDIMDYEFCCYSLHFVCTHHHICQFA